MPIDGGGAPLGFLFDKNYGLLELFHPALCQSASIKQKKKHPPCKYSLPDPPFTCRNTGNPKQTRATQTGDKRLATTPPHPPPSSDNKYHLADFNPCRRCRAPLRRDRLPSPLENLHLPFRLASSCVPLFPLRQGCDFHRTRPLDTRWWRQAAAGNQNSHGMCRFTPSFGST